MNQEITHQPGEIERAIGPLRLVFWGGILCVFDFKFNGFDIFNDVLGAILIAWGVFKLSGFRIDERYRSAMLFIKIISVLYIAQTIKAYIHFEITKPVSFLIHVFGIAKMLATVLFCVAMRWLCKAAGLTKSDESWKITMILFAVIYLVPFGLLNLTWIVCLITGGRFHFNLGPAVCFLLIVFFVPVIHLFISTSRMKTEAESISANPSVVKDLLDEVDGERV